MLLERHQSHGTDRVLQATASQMSQMVLSRYLHCSLGMLAAPCRVRRRFWSPPVPRLLCSQASGHQSQQLGAADSAHGSLQLNLDEDSNDAGQSQHASSDPASDVPQEEEVSEALHQQPSQSLQISAGADGESEDGDLYQGLIAADADNAHLKQSGYSLSEDELASVLEADPTEADAAASLHGDCADREQAVLEKERHSLDAGAQDILLTTQQPEDQQAPLYDGQSEPMHPVSPSLSRPMVEPLTLCIGSPESAGVISVVSAAQDMDVDIEATGDWSAGSEVEVRHDVGGLWAWQSAKLCAPVTPTTARVKVDYVTKFGSTCKDMSVQQLRLAPPARTYISTPRGVDRGSVVEVNMGHGRYVPAVVLHSSRQLQKPIPSMPSAEDKDGRHALAGIASALAADDDSGVRTHHNSHACEATKPDVSLAGQAVRCCTV